MVPIGVFHFCMSLVSASSFFASHTITSHRFTSPCMVAILLSCSGFSVSIMVTFHVSIFSRSLFISTFDPPNVSMATASFKPVSAFGPQSACTEGIPFGAFAITPA